LNDHFNASKPRTIIQKHPLKGEEFSKATYVSCFKGAHSR